LSGSNREAGETTWSTAPSKKYAPRGAAKQRGYFLDGAVSRRADDGQVTRQEDENEALWVPLMNRKSSSKVGVTLGVQRR